MPDSLYFYMMIVVIIFAAGDMIGQFTRGKLSGLMVVMLLFLFGFVSGILPKDIINQAGLSHLAAISTAMVLFNMGASMENRSYGHFMYDRILYYHVFSCTHSWY